jgi:hypothetical protein
MARRLLIPLAFAMLAMGCESYAVRTRSTPNGGAYVLMLARQTEQAVQSTTRDVLGDMIAECSGSYEVVDIRAVPADSGDLDGIYLDPSDKPVRGPFRTMISYECRRPEQSALNHRLYLIAAPMMDARLQRNGGEPGCVETWDCARGAICEPKPCEGEH